MAQRISGSMTIVRPGEVPGRPSEVWSLPQRPIQLDAIAAARVAGWRPAARIAEVVEQRRVRRTKLPWTNKHMIVAAAQPAERALSTSSGLADKNSLALKAFMYL